jgi:hypothetical protein
MKTSYMLINIRDPLNGSEVTLHDVQMKRWPMLFRVSGGNVFFHRRVEPVCSREGVSEGDTI